MYVLRNYEISYETLSMQRLIIIYDGFAKGQLFACRLIVLLSKSGDQNLQLEFVLTSSPSLTHKLM